MTKKAGDEYNALAEDLARVLESGAEVKRSEWVKGPDGKREVDVTVRGTREGKPYFFLIECKDWQEPVDVTAVDGLHSKSQDLGADRVMLCSNSGFSSKAIRKASRLGIEVVSVMAAHDRRVRLRLSQEYRAKALSVDKWSMKLWPSVATDTKFPVTWDCRELYYQGLPVQNWAHALSSTLLKQHEGARQITASFALKRETEFRLGRDTVTLVRFQLRLECSRKWVSQVVSEDVSLGLYDYVRKRITVPDQQRWSLGPFDRDTWKETDEPVSEQDEELEPGTFRLSLTLLNPIPPHAQAGTPKLDDLIGEREVRADQDPTDA